MRDLQDAVADGDTRTVSLHHVHTNEDITITYKRDGRYDEAALEKLNWFLRDWRRSEQTRMDPALIDLVWEVQREVGSSQPIYVVCGYRAPETNAMLRHRSSGVARFSQHMLGKAMDFYIPGAPLSELRMIGLRLARGGVGFYPTSGSPFVHMDTGNVRMWPRMSREELARVFPDGRTVQIPTDGRPMPGYALALADIRKHGGDASSNSVATAHDAGMNITAVANNVHMVNPFAKLFGLAKDDEDEDSDTVADAAPAASGNTDRGIGRTQSKPVVVASADAKPPASSAYHLASVPRDSHAVASEATPPAPQSVTSRFAELSPNQIISARGYWQGLANGVGGDQSDAQAALQNALRQRSVQIASADSDVTGSLNSWPGGNDGGHEPAQFALAYAAERAALTPPSPSSAPKAAAADPQPSPQSGKLIAEGGTSIAAKGMINQPKTSYQTAIELTADKVTKDDPDNPWLRAVILSPSVEHYLTALALCAPDYTTLAALMVKPARSVMMTFSADPYLGLAADRFNGSAIVFVSTVTYAGSPTYTAALQ